MTWYGSGFAAEWWNYIWERYVFGRFWTLHVNAKDLVMNLVYKNWLGCFRNTLAACFAFASEFGCFGATSFFSWMCMMFFDNWFDWFSTMDRNVFFCCVLHSQKLHVFFSNFVDKKNVTGICEKFEMSLKLRR